MGDNGPLTGREVSHLIVAGLNESSESQGSKDLASRGFAGAGGSVMKGRATETAVACVRLSFEGESAVGLVPTVRAEIAGREEVGLKPEVRDL